MLETLDTAVLELDESNRVRLMNGAAEQCLATGRERIEGLELEVGHGAGGVLQEAVVDSEADLGARGQLPFNHMILQYFLRECAFHALSLRSQW